MDEVKDYVGFFNRLFAFIIDIFIIIFIGTMITYSILGLLSIFTTIDPNSFEAIASTMIIYPLIFWLYYAISESSPWMSTFGKKLLGIKVVDYSLNRVSFSKATVRFLAKFLSILLLWIGFIIIAFTKKKQGLHDIISECYVVKK